MNMARPRKNIEPILGTGKDPEDKLTVQKSTPLFSLWRSDMTLAEFKILDTYLSRINSHTPEKRTVIFTKGELEQLLGVAKINKTNLSQRLNNLGRFVDLEKQDHKIHKVALFEEAYGESDDNGLWQVKLTCTPSAMKYIFNIEELGYLRYKLRCITSLTSRYTYILFMYLETNRFRKTWDVQLDELRQLLNCTDELYNEYKYFNQRILQRSQKELHEKTECRFTYVPIRVGRKTTAIRFTLETIADILPENNGELEGQQQIPWFDEDINDPMVLLSSACNNEFTREEMQVIFSILCTKELYHPDGIEMARFHYLQRKYALLNLRAQTVRIPHRHAYFVAMLENDD